jgi:hypothetical protein
MPTFGPLGGVEAMSDTVPWYNNIFTCAVCTGMTTGAIEFFKDTKYIKAVEGALGMWCFFKNQMTTYTCAKIISQYANGY